MACRQLEKILDTLLIIFIGSKLLKLIGPALFNALFSKFSWSGITGIVSKIGGWLLKALGLSTFASGMALGIKAIFNDIGLASTLKMAFTDPLLVKEVGGWGKMLGAIFSQALVAVAGGVIAGGSIIKGSEMVADASDYNLGLKAAGGKDEDLKSTFGGKALATIGGGIGGGMMAGAIFGSSAGPIGTAIGAVAGLLISSLQPAIESVKTSARDMNNEMQNIGYYKGTIQGATTEVEEMDEYLKLVNDTFDVQKNKVYALGEEYGIGKDRMNELVKAVEDGTYKSDMLCGSEKKLADALDVLSSRQEQNRVASEKLIEAKKKLQKAELDLAIFEDIAAGNFEMAEARIEYALATELYEGDEAAAKLAQIMKEMSFNESQELLANVSSELKTKWDEYLMVGSKGIDDYAQIFEKANKYERNNLLEDMEPELRTKFLSYLATTGKWQSDYIKYYNNANVEVKKAFDDPSVTAAAEKAGKKNAQALVNGLKSATIWDKFVAWLKNLFPGGETSSDYYTRKGITTSSHAVGTNYVPSDGLTYIHKGEAIIPANENIFAGQGRAWETQMVANDKMLNAINRLEATVSQGITVSGEFKQRGSDLVATVNKVNSRQNTKGLSNLAYAR